MKTDSLKQKYGFRQGSTKYLIPGGELFKYIGQAVVLTEFNKKPAEKEGEEPTWENKFSEVVIKSISDFDPVYMTWVCKYVPTAEGAIEEKSVTILPEGYSFEGEKGPEETGHLARFLPLSKHYQLLEEDTFFRTLEDKWNNVPTLSKEDLTMISQSKGQEGTLRYTHNIGALVRLDDEYYDEKVAESRFLWIRIHKLSFFHKAGTRYRLQFSNEDRSWTSIIDTNDAEFAFEDLGKFKIIDLGL